MHVSGLHLLFDGLRLGCQRQGELCGKELSASQPQLGVRRCCADVRNECREQRRRGNSLCQLTQRVRCARCGGGDLFTSTFRPSFLPPLCLPAMSD